ncbi:hypothetical protein ACWKWU_22295 [Chitinophaga lutea]
MRTSLVIPKDPVYPPSMDWQLLRREGIRHIEHLASDIWTDYNLHDPGITILEILCYALTDLGYRSNMPPADLFASPEGGSFYTAAHILPCAPVTALDLRKVLIDIPGVHNAWVEQLEEPEVRIFWPGIPDNNLAKETLQSILGALGEPEFGWPEPPGIDLATLLKTYACLSDKEKKAAREEFRDAMRAALGKPPVLLCKALLTYAAVRFQDETDLFLRERIGEPEGPGDERLYFGILDLQEAMPEIRQHWKEQTLANYFRWGNENDGLVGILYKNPTLMAWFAQDVLLGLYFSGSLRVGELVDPPGSEDYNLFVPQGVYSVTLRLEEGREADATDIVAEAKRRLHRLRNLSEDIHPHIRIAETVGMGLDLALDLDPAADKWEVLANVYRAVTGYLSPDIRFYSLEEMMNRYAQFEVTADVIAELEEMQLPVELTEALRPLTGKRIAGDVAFKVAVAIAWDAEAMEDYYADLFIRVKKYYDADSVYKGPLLQHGFIEEAELAAAQPRQTVYRSDLYQVIAAVEGVIQIDRLDMYVCKEDGVREDAGKWCIAFDCKCLPELSLDCSRISVYSNYSEVQIDMLKLREYLDVHPAPVTKINRQDMLDLPVPEGRTLDGLTDFTSIQMDFPRTYKIGTTGISKQQPELRQAQAKQLKGYLFFYDQLLANYLSHLASVKEYFSVNGTEAPLYQPLYSIPGIREVLLDFKGEDDPSWEAFTAGENDYIRVIRELAEGNETDRKLYRNRILDHMLARFGEQFTDYALQLYRIERPLSDGNVWETDEGLEEAMADKRRFLQQVPSLGARRASGFVYQFEKDEFRYWKTDNVEGVRKRVCAILGIQDATRHTITCEPVFDVGVGEMDAPGSASANVATRYEYYVKAVAPAKGRLLVSVEKFSSYDTAKKARMDFLNRAGDRNAYGIVPDEQRVGFWVNVPEADRTAANALLLEPYEGREGAEKRLQHLRDLASGNCNDDSFHLLEHILLRPRTAAFTELLRPMVNCVDDVSLMDPYSFWITIVLPDWTGRFSDPARRDVFMQTLRREMPAHLQVRYALLTREDMLRFESAYNEWIRRLCTKGQPDFADANDALVALMNEWDENKIHYF